MADFSLDLQGFQQSLADLDDEIDNVRTQQEFLVGTAVEYSIYLELGTSDMNPRPYFGPAINEVRLQGVDGFIRHNSRTSVSQLDEASEVLKVLALALERRVKEIITRKGLIDTGTLRASIVAIVGDNPRLLPDEADFSGFSSSSPAPPSAGRALASQTISFSP